MNTVSIKDKKFDLFITQQQIEAAIEKIASQMSKDLDGKNPLFICVLNGAFMFASELMKRVNVPAELTFVKVSSYSGVNTTGKVTELIGLVENIEGRTIVIVEDIVDTGRTMRSMLDQLSGHNPKEIKISTLLFKPEALIEKLHLDYVALEIPSDFIVGYGLDYDGYGRNYPDIYKVVE